MRNFLKMLDEVENETIKVLESDREKAREKNDEDALKALENVEESIKKQKEVQILSYEVGRMDGQFPHFMVGMFVGALVLFIFNHL